MRVKLVVGNWKMNGALATNAALLDRLVSGAGAVERGKQLAVCVPYPYLAQARERLAGTPVAWGAQDVGERAAGAFTGDVSCGMVAEFGCRYVIVGHSERRQVHGETDALVAAKARAVLDAGMTPIVCVGETLAEREAMLTETVVGRQVDEAIEALGRDVARVVVAYEPVWAIGTGRTATPEQAREVHGLLRGRLASAGAAEVALLYGGSVKAA